jgi:hypothetical protein
MSDYSSELPIRSQYPGQSLPDDVIIKIGDGTNPTTQLATVLPASTSAIATNTALVVAFSPNSPLPAGSATIGSVNQGTSPWITSDLADGSVAPGTAGTKSMLGGLVYESSGITLTNGQQAALQGDASGNLKVNLETPIPAGSNTIGAVTQAGGPWTTNLTEVGGSAIALGQTTMSASIPVTIASNQSAIPVTQSTSPWVVSGTVAVTQSTSPWVTQDESDGSVTGGTAGTYSSLAGGQYNSSAPTLTTGQQAALQLDVNGNLKVDLATPLPAGTNNIGATNANIYVSGSPATLSNPVPVTITSASSGTPIQNFTVLTSIAVLGNATATYTVPATHTFSLERVFVSAEVRIKIIVSNNGTAIFTAFNSSSNPNIDLTVTAPPTIVAGNTVTVQVFNIDVGASNAYVTIEGNQIT